MPTFKVFHLVTNDRFARFEEPSYRTLWPASYVEVATVEAPELGATFELTNSIYGPWVENEGVTPSAAVLKAGGARSTSVGDVVVQEDGRVFGVAGSGFEEITSKGLNPADWGLQEAVR